MGRLDNIGFVELLWREEKDTGWIFATGLQNYAIDTDNEVTVIRDDQVVNTFTAIDLHHAVGMVTSHEAVCRWKMREKPSLRKSLAPFTGYMLDKVSQIEVDLYQAYDSYQTEIKRNELGGNALGVRSAECFAEGIAHVLGILRGTDCDQEWDEIEKKWKEANEPQSHGSQAQTETTPI